MRVTTHIYAIQRDHKINILCGTDPLPDGDGVVREDRALDSGNHLCEACLREWGYYDDE